VEVRDNGIGIDPDLLPHVFEMFAQGKTDTSHKQDGLGIGLSLVQSLVHMHGGTVSVRSEGPGKGAEFSIRLPLTGRTVAAPPAAVLAACRLEEPPSDMRILVVDDNHDAANSLALILEALGIETRTAHGGLEGLRIADAFQPSIAILDVGMPGMDGCEVATRLRANPRHAGIVLIALTGWGHIDDIGRCREAGFDHHIRKPADVPALVALLDDIRSRSDPSMPLQAETSHAGVQSPC
jgi:CheY-like chemotaxis protein